MNSCSSSTSTTTPYHYQQRYENLLNIGVRNHNLHITSSSSSKLNMFQQTPIAEDILKTGVLKVGKRGQKKFFVVRQDSYNSPARIDRYNSFKQFQTGAKSDFSVLFKDVFSVNKTVISKDNVAGIAVFTPTKTMYMGCGNDMERDAWLYVIKNVLRSSKDDHFCPTYDHVWDVKLLKTGLAGKQGPLLGGPCRLCFSDCSLFLCPLFAPHNSPKIVEFPLICISNFGLSYEHELYLRVGRSAITGPGQMWIVHDEAIVLNDIHNILSKIMLENNELRAKNRAAVASVIATFQNSRGRSKTMPGDAVVTRPNISRAKSEVKAYARCSSASSIPVDSPYQLMGSSHENSNHSLKELASVDDGTCDKLVLDASTSGIICGGSNDANSPNTKENESYVPMFKKDEQDRRSTDYSRKSNWISVVKTSNNRTVHELGRIDEYTPMCPAEMDDLSHYASSGSDIYAKKSYNLEEVKSYIRIDDGYQTNRRQFIRENIDHNSDHNQETNLDGQTSSSSSSSTGEIENDGDKNLAEKNSSTIDDRNVVESNNSSAVKRVNSQRNSTSDQQEILPLHERPPTPTPSTSSSLSGFTSFINDFRRRCYSFGGSLSKKLKRKCSGEGKLDQPVDGDFRRRSESFGSHKSKATSLYSYNSLTTAPYSRMTPSSTTGPCGFLPPPTERRSSNYSDNFLELNFGSSSTSNHHQHQKHWRKNRETLSGSSPTCSSLTAELTPSAAFLKQMAAEYEDKKQTNRNNSFSYGEYVTMDNSIKIDSFSNSGAAADHHQCSKSLTDMDDSSPASLSSCCVAENFQRSCSLEQSSENSDQSPHSLASSTSKVSDVFENSSMTIINDSTKKDVEKVIDANKTIIRADVHVSSPSGDTSDDETSQQRAVRKTSKSSSSPKTLSYTKLDENALQQHHHKNLNLNSYESQSLSKNCKVVKGGCKTPPAFSFSNRSISASMLENLLVVDASNLRQIFLQQQQQQKRSAGQTSGGAANFTMKTVLAAN